MNEGLITEYCLRNKQVDFTDILPNGTSIEIIREGKGCTLFMPLDLGPCIETYLEVFSRVDKHLAGKAVIVIDRIRVSMAKDTKSPPACVDFDCNENELVSNAVVEEKLGEILAAGIQCSKEIFVQYLSKVVKISSRIRSLDR